jgi:hypothetical protein
MRFSRQDGQTLVLSVVFMTVLLGMAAVVLDVGTWYRADRATQAAADAAVLAAAQALPEDPARADDLARLYRDKNEGVGDVTDVTISSKNYANDTVTVKLERTAPGFFAKLFGIDSVTVGSTASARVAGVTSAKWVAPFGVDKAHPLISGLNDGRSCPCFGVDTELDLEKVGPGAFRIINVDGSYGGTGPGVLEDWILHGLNAYMELGEYYSDAGAKFNSSNVRDAMSQRVGEELLFPVYDRVVGGGSGAQYRVIGWIGFQLDSFEPKGSGGKIYGSFTKFIAQGFQTSTGGNPNSDNYNGVRAIALVD